MLFCIGRDLALNENQISKALFDGRVAEFRRICGQNGYAFDTINAYQCGLSVPEVALNYRYEPIQAMSMIATCCHDYSFDLVARLSQRMS